ncbi:MAG: hypothetical protein HY721_21260 [Planctomycetes bacterium]|nr:hypothetical protein [Planctomycetota bacterium]
MTDDPGTPGDGNWEVNLAIAAEKRDSERTIEAPLLDVNYGVGERIQLKFELPWFFLREEGEESKNGLGNSQIGAKWRFLDQEAHWLDVSVYPQVEFNNPTSSARRGLVEEGIAWVLPFQMEKSFGHLSVNPELGYVFLEAEDEWLYGLAVGFSPLDGLELLAEVHGSAERDFEDDELLVQAGCRWSAHPNLTLLGAVGRGIRHSEEGGLELVAYVGVQLLFGKDSTEGRGPHIVE